VIREDRPKNKKV